VAERAKAVAIPAPVADLVEAWNARSADRFAAALAPDVRITVPPLHLELGGRDEAWDGVARLFGAFGALRYTSRHRYLTPGNVTDEVLLEGLQTREFLGAQPSGRPGAVAARVILRHDGHHVTALTLWPDIAALRELSAGMARRIDLRSAGAAAPMMAALRATIPSTEGKLSVGEGRQVTESLLPQDVPPPAPAEQPPQPPAGKEPKGKGGKGKDGKGKDGPKAPLSRKARRRRAVAAGALMLALAGVLGAYVVQGVSSTKDPVVAVRPSPQPTATRAAATPTPTATATPTPTASPSASPSPSRSVTFNKRTNTFKLPDLVLFQVNEAELRPDARQALEQVVQALVKENRYGTIVVTGYTDDTGTQAFNKRLSTARAGAVRRYLLERLPDDGRWTVRALGRGSANPVAVNDSEANREQNRRVEIKVPRASAAER
jgi:outer membrane protein OmpA-like peptidoglycan-associated protein